jgi:hypothetical protein
MISRIALMVKEVRKPARRGGASRRVGVLALRPMGHERMAACVRTFLTPLANAGKMPALLEAGKKPRPLRRVATLHPADE